MSPRVILGRFDNSENIMFKFSKTGRATRRHESQRHPLVQSTAGDKAGDAGHHERPQANDVPERRDELKLTTPVRWCEEDNHNDNFELH